MSMRAFIFVPLAGLALAAAPCAAQDPFGTPHDPFGRATVGEQAVGNGEYSPSTYTSPSSPSTTYQPDVLANIHRRAQARAAERQLRLATLHWYGMSNGRPTASPTPFTSLYSPVWQMPGGRPFAWYHWGWPTYYSVNTR